MEDEMYLHIQMFPVTDPKDIEIPKMPTEEQWLRRAIELFKLTDHYYEIPEKDREAIENTHKNLRAVIPETLKDRTMVLVPGGGFMGEDIVLDTGRVTTTLQTSHRSCGTYRVIERGDGTLFCIECARLTSFNECGDGP